ncbi:MAG: GNAT family N-acetyltransferase [Gammaproteobacteria bacterium]|nr:GNAT family N-acetyltransferase [Gammaproteobacteria bacterium]
MGEESINIRGAEKEDVSSLVKFNILMARETEGKELIPEEISLGVKNLLENLQLGFYIVAENKDEIIASLMITTEWSDWRNGSFWWVQSVYVIPEWRKKSVYSRLYGYVKDLAEKDGNICGFRLYVEKDNTIAQQTYKKVGMKETNYMMFEELKPSLLN